MNEILARIFGTSTNNVPPENNPPVEPPSENEPSIEKDSTPPETIPIADVQALTAKFMEELEKRNQDLAAKDEEINSIKTQLNTLFKLSPTPKQDAEPPAKELSPEELLNKSVDDYFNSSNSITNRYLQNFNTEGNNNAK